MNYPTEPDLTIKPGERVISFDFPERTDHYVEGIVEDIVESRDSTGVRLYKIVMQYKCVGGVRRPSELAYVFAPVNGTPMMFGGPTRGVMRVPE
jgi:hypothetical protein